MTNSTKNVIIYRPQNCVIVYPLHGLPVVQILQRTRSLFNSRLPPPSPLYCTLQITPTII